MENINNSRGNILKPSIYKQEKFTFKKSPIAKVVVSTLLILGNFSAISYAKNTAPSHTGAVNEQNITLTSRQIAKDTVINGTGTLKLTGKSKAYNTQVNTDNIFPFRLEGNSKAVGSKVYNGSMDINNDATASGTEIGFVTKDNKIKSITTMFDFFNKTLGRMDISQQGKAHHTKVGMQGMVYLGGTGIMENTHIQEGGKLVVHNLQNAPTLKNTRVAGVLTLEPGSDVVLQGKTEFLPTAKLNVKSNEISNDGQLIFRNGGVVLAYIDGKGSLIKEGANTLTLQGNGNTKIEDYTYSGETYINNGDLQLSSAILIDSPVIGKKNTHLFLNNNSELRTTVQGSGVFINSNSL